MTDVGTSRTDSLLPSEGAFLEKTSDPIGSKGLLRGTAQTDLRLP